MRPPCSGATHGAAGDLLRRTCQRQGSPGRCLWHGLRRAIADGRQRSARPGGTGTRAATGGPCRPKVYCQNSIRWSALRRACAACSLSATCVPKLHPCIAAGWSETGATSEVRQLGCSTCEAYWASCWRVSTSAWPKCCVTRACSLWDTRCWALRRCGGPIRLWRSPAHGHGLRRWLCHGLRAHQRIRWGFRVQQPWHGCAYRVAGRFPAVPLAAEAEAILTVGILRQMLAGQTRSIRPVTGLLPQMIAQPASRWENAPRCRAQRTLAHWDLLTAIPAVAVDAMEDMAQLERLVNRLAGEPRQRRHCPPGVRQCSWHPPHLHGSFVAPTESRRWRPTWWPT